MRDQSVARRPAHDHKCRIAGSGSIGQRSAALLMSDRMLSEAEIDELIAS